MSNSAQTVSVHTVRCAGAWSPDGPNPVITSLQADAFSTSILHSLKEKSTLRCTNVSISDFQKFKELLSDQSDAHTRTHTHTPIKYTQQSSEWEPKKWMMEGVAWKPVMLRKRWTNSPLFITASWKVSWQVVPRCSPLLFWCQTKLSDKCVST